MGQAKTDRDLAIELYEIAQKAVEDLQTIREEARKAFDRHCVTGHSVTRAEMDSLCRFLLETTEEYAE